MDWFLYGRDLHHERVTGEHHHETCLRLVSWYLKVFGKRSSKKGFVVDFAKFCDAVFGDSSDKWIWQILEF